MIIDWERVRFHSRCKVCKLYRIYKDLFMDIHEMVLHIGFSQPRAMLYANSKIEEYNEKASLDGLEGLQFFNRMNFNTHFNKHLPINVTTALKLRTQSINAVRPEYEETESVMQELMNNSVQNNLSDYERLSSLVERFEVRFNELDRALDDEKGMSWSRVQDYTTLVRELSRARQELIKLKQSERLIGLVISQLLNNYTTKSLKSILRSVEQIQARIESAGYRDLSLEVAKLLRESIVDGMQDSAKDAVSAIKEEFRLSL